MFIVKAGLVIPYVNKCVNRFVLKESVKWCNSDSHEKCTHMIGSITTFGF